MFNNLPIISQNHVDTTVLSIRDNDLEHYAEDTFKLLWQSNPRLAQWVESAAESMDEYIADAIGNIDDEASETLNWLFICEIFALLDLLDGAAFEIKMTSK